MQAPQFSAGRILVSGEFSQTVDRKAWEEWHFHPFALVEAAGRRCGEVFSAAFPRLFQEPPSIAVLAGPGNNGADALVMLRSWLLRGQALPGRSLVLLIRPPQGTSPLGETAASLRAMGVPLSLWEEGPWADTLSRRDILIDGIFGTGLRRALEGVPAEMVSLLHRVGGIQEGGLFPYPSSHTGGFPLRPPCDRASSARLRRAAEARSTPRSTASLRRPLVVSIDLPSGLSDAWRPGMPVVEAQVTLAIEPVKAACYLPGTRPFAGIILPVGGIFPPALLRDCTPAPAETPAQTSLELLDWDEVKGCIPAPAPGGHKYDRGLVEIWAGSPGCSGAPVIAARGAQAAGAGLVRLILDREIYPLGAAGAGGIQVYPGDASGPGGLLPGGASPDCLLLGPGWGQSPERKAPLERALEMEAAGIPLVLDADGIALARDRVFHGNALLTPHLGEFARLTGRTKEEILGDTRGILLRTAREKNAVILLKGCTILIASPEGRIALVDGLNPGLAAGGTGDLLAGFCAALIGRVLAGRRHPGGSPQQSTGGGGAEGEGPGVEETVWRPPPRGGAASVRRTAVPLWQDPSPLWTCGVVAAALLEETGRQVGRRFAVALELAALAGGIAGEAWL